MRAPGLVGVTTIIHPATGSWVWVLGLVMVSEYRIPRVVCGVGVSNGNGVLPVKPKPCGRISKNPYGRMYEALYPIWNVLAMSRDE